MRMGASAGLALRYQGFSGRLAGSWLRAALMEACTSRAAASILRSTSNCRVTEDAPSELDEVIWLTPAMRPNWRSRGVATDEAMVSGLAPGRAALMPTTGKSTLGSEATGRMEYATEPAIRRASERSEVATGRRM